MGSLRRVIPYLLFPSDPAHCAPAGHAPRSVSAPMISQSRCCWGTAVSEITGIAHRSGGRVGDGFALFPPVFPRSSALSGYTQFLRWSGWRRKLSLRREFSPALLAAPATLPLRRSSGCARRWIRWEIKTGDPLSSFPIRSSVRCNALCSRRARSEECVRAYESRAPAAAEAPRRVRSRGSHIDLADGLETGSPYFHLYSPGLAAVSLQEDLFVLFRAARALPRHRAHYGDSRFIYALQTVFTCLGVWLHLILNN